MPKVGQVKANKCKACGGTGVNSRGNPCRPCVENGRVTFPKKTEPKVVKQGKGLFD